MSFGKGFTVSPLTASAIQNFAADVLAIAGGGGFGSGDALTGSTNIFRANQIISGNLDIGGTITAKQFNVITSSVLYESGSTKFGDTPEDTHQFTGSVISSVGFTGSFYGDGNNLTGLPSASIDHVIFVTKGGNDTTGNGSITKPFLTVQAAINYASSSYPMFSEGVQIEIAPGLYNENVTLNRHNTYIVSSLKKAEQRSVTIRGNFTINCTAAAQKFNHIVGLEGIYFDNSEDSTSPTLLLTGSATSGHLTYLKGCYVAQNSSGSNANAFKTSGLRFSNNFSGSKITAQNTTFLAQKAGADVVSLDGGDYRFDFCEVYCNVTGSSTTGSGIRIVGETALLMDRAIVEIYTNGYAVSNASTKTTNTICFISNTSLSSTGAGSVGIVSSSTDIILWNDIFTGYNATATYPNYKINGTASKVAYFSHLTAPVPITSTGITLFPLAETHGTIVAASVTSSLGFSGSLSSSYLVGTIPVSKGGTGAITFSGNSLLIASGSNAFTSLTGSAAADKYVVAWNATGSNFVLTASAGGGGLASVLTSGSVTGSGVLLNEVRLKDDVSSNTFTASVGFSGPLFGQATSALTASYVNALTQSVYIIGNLSASAGITGSFSGSGAGLTNVASSLVYATATPALAVTQVVALSGGLVAASATDRLRANGFGVIQNSSSAGYVVQTSGEALVAFSSSNRNLLVTGSEFYVSSSGTASLYEDITGSAQGRYATQIGYLNRVSGSNYYIIISPRPFGLVY